MLTVAYYRRSSTMQEHSIELQRYKAFEVAKKQNLIVQKEFTDDAISARKTTIDERAELQSLLNLIKKKQVKNILVYKRDRLARNVVQHLKMYRLFREYDVNVIFTADEELPMNFSSNGELYEIFIGCMVQLEGKQIHERLKAKREANFRSGKNPGNLPYGYAKNQENTSLYIGSESKPVYRCSKCKNELPKDHLEQTIIDHLLVYIKSLLQNQFQQLIEKHRERNQKTLQKRLHFEKQVLETIKQNLFAQVASEIETEKDSFDPILETYSKYKEQIKKIDDITTEIYLLDELPTKIEAIKTHMLKTKTTQDLLNLRSKEIVHDIIDRITVEDVYIDLVYKYPFAGLKEAHNLGIK